MNLLSPFTFLSRLSCLAPVLGAWLLTATQAAAQLPRNVEIIVPYSTGGTADTMARLFAAEASRLTQKQWIVTNRPGAGGLVGFAALSNARADGSTVVFGPASALTNAPFVTARMPFAPSRIAPVCHLFENVFAISVAQNSPIQTLPQLIDAARKAPNTLSYGHAGPASVPHLSIAAIENAAGIRFIGVPYQTDAATWNDLYGGSLSFVAQPLATSVGKPVRILAILSDQRHFAAPEVPPVTDFGLPAMGPGLNGLFAPADIPAAALAELDTVCAQVARSESFSAAAKSARQVPKLLGPTEFARRLQREHDANARLVPSLRLDKN